MIFFMVQVPFFISSFYYSSFLLRIITKWWYRPRRASRRACGCPTGHRGRRAACTARCAARSRHRAQRRPHRSKRCGSRSHPARQITGQPSAGAFSQRRHPAPCAARKVFAVVLLLEAVDERPLLRATRPTSARTQVCGAAVHGHRAAEREVMLSCSSQPVRHSRSRPQAGCPRRSGGRLASRHFGRRRRTTMGCVPSSGRPAPARRHASGRCAARCGRRYRAGSSRWSSRSAG